MAEVAVGKLFRARGNRGELLAEIYSSRPGRAEKLKEVTLEVDGRRRNAMVERVWCHDGRPVFKFAGIDSIARRKSGPGLTFWFRKPSASRPRKASFLTPT